MDFFSSVDDHVIENIFYQLLNEETTAARVRSALRLGITCKRMHRISCGKDVWKCIDPAWFLSNKSDLPRLCHMLQDTRFAMCERFCPRINNVPFTWPIALLGVLPNLRCLAISLCSPVPTSTLPTEIASAFVPAKALLIAPETVIHVIEA